MNQIRSDLAVEICQHIQKHTPDPDGIQCTKSRLGHLTVEEVRITSDEGAKSCGKPRGRYLTAGAGKLWLDDRDVFREKVIDFSSLLKDMMKDKAPDRRSVLVAGLGNSNITADAVGPAAVKNVIVTRHLKKEKPLIFEDLGLFDVCAVTPGVLGQTGIESADVVKSLVRSIQPAMVLVIDALASRSLERLVTTVQICDSGIAPGSGVGNGRPALNEGELGVPVISIGVPTVVDAATLASDAIAHFSGGEGCADQIRQEWSRSDLNFFVTPKETDQVIEVMGSFLGFGINLALNPDLTYEDMLSLVGGI